MLEVLTIYLGITLTTDMPEVLILYLGMLVVIVPALLLRLWPVHAEVDRHVRERLKKTGLQYEKRKQRLL